MILYRTMNRGREPFVPLTQSIPQYRQREDALNRRMNGEALPPPADASPAFADILLKACAWHPQKRYASARALAADLRSLQRGTYQSKKKPAKTYGKHNRFFYLKCAAAALAACGALVLCAKPAAYAYREHFVDYCDQSIMQRIMEEYDCTLKARLTGNGVLYLESDADLYCSRNTGEFPWVNEKNRIRKIVFGEKVTRFAPTFSYGLSLSVGEPETSADTFRYCQNLEEIEIKGDSFFITGVSPFQGDELLTTITSPTNSDVLIEGNPLDDVPWILADGFRMIGNTLVTWNGDEETLEDFPEQIQRLGDLAFSRCTSLKSVTLPDGITVLPSDCFEFCSNLTTLQLPEGLTDILTPFTNCVSLQSLNIPASVTTIHAGFVNCRRLTNLQIAPGNTAFVLEDGVLYNREKSELIWCDPARTGTLTLPDTLQSMATNAFSSAMALEGLVIPDEASAISTSFFGLCPNLKRIDISGEHPGFSLADGLLRSKNGQALYFCLRGRAGKVTVPEGTLTLLNYAFASCKDLTQVQLPSSLQYIFNQAFADCTGLTSITLPHSLTRITNDVFTGCTNLKDLYYEGSAEEWEQLTADFDLGLSSDVTVHFA